MYFNILGFIRLNSAMSKINLQKYYMRVKRDNMKGNNNNSLLTLELFSRSGLKCPLDLREKSRFRHDPRDSFEEAEASRDVMSFPSSMWSKALWVVLIPPTLHQQVHPSLGRILTLLRVRSLLQKLLCKSS